MTVCLPHKPAAKNVNFYHRSMNVEPNTIQSVTFLKSAMGAQDTVHLISLYKMDTFAKLGALFVIKETVLTRTRCVRKRMEQVQRMLPLPAMKKSRVKLTDLATVGKTSKTNMYSVDGGISCVGN